MNKRIVQETVAILLPLNFKGAEESLQERCQQPANLSRCRRQNSQFTIRQPALFLWLGVVCCTDSKKITGNKTKASQDTFVFLLKSTVIFFHLYWHKSYNIDKITSITIISKCQETPLFVLFTCHWIWTTYLLALKITNFLGSLNYLWLKKTFLWADLVHTVSSFVSFFTFFFFERACIIIFCCFPGKVWAKVLLSY